jgi:hypothetical protein
MAAGFNPVNPVNPKALAKLRFARAVFRIQNSEFRMNSRRTDSKPAHCKILTTES